MLIKSVVLLLVAICITASSVSAQIPMFPPFRFPFPFPFPFPNPFHPSPGGMPGFPGIPGFPNPFQPSPGGMPGFPGIPGFPNPFKPSPGGMPGFPGIPGFPNPFQPSPGGMPGTPGGMPGTPGGMPGTPGGMPGTPGVPYLFQSNPGMPGIPDLSKCWSSEMMDLPGCIAEIRQSIMTGKHESIGPACCKAFLDAEANCSHNLPFDPFFPPMIKEKCSQSAGPPTTIP